jgi:heparinase II/III-like protein/alginate lyase
MRKGLVSVALLAAPLFCQQPHLLLDSRDLNRIRNLTSTQAWAEAVVRALVRGAEAWPADHVREFGLKEWAIPQEGAGWSHAYVCPEHGVRLTQQGGKNICPVDGKDYHGWPIDNVVYMQRNDDNARAARDLGLAYRLTGNVAFADKARRIFNAYAELYPRLPIHDNNKLDTRTGARVMSQTLSEAKWLVPLEFGYDLVRDAMPAPERERFETNVLKNAAAVIARNDAGGSNWQSWHNAALLAAGLLMADRTLTQLAVDGPGGFRFQLREGINRDGEWHEGSWGYHFFALDPLLQTREMAARAGIPVPEAKALKRMLDAPLECLFPDGSLPNFNDSGFTGLTGEARYYDIGYRLFGELQYGFVARGSRRGIESLLWGADQLPPGVAPPLASAVLPESGLAILRVHGSDHTIAMKFGPHGGGHGHFDKLTFISYANGSHLATDPGTQAYASPTHNSWDKLTVAHNTLVADQATQAAATGSLLSWTALPDATAIRASAGPVYPQIELHRTLVLTAEYALDVSEAQTTDKKPHSFDWVYHNLGSLSTDLPQENYTGLPKSNGYQHLAGARAAATGDQWRATFRGDHANLRVSMIGASGTTVVAGQGLGPDLQVPVPFLMARRKASNTIFAALYEPYLNGPATAAFLEESGTYIVERNGLRDRIALSPFSLMRTAGGVPVRAVLAAGAASAFAESSLSDGAEIEWGPDVISVTTQNVAKGTLRIRAAEARTFRVNGSVVPARSEGDFRVVTIQ